MPDCNHCADYREKKWDRCFRCNQTFDDDASIITAKRMIVAKYANYCAGDTTHMAALDPSQPLFISRASIGRGPMVFTQREVEAKFPYLQHFQSWTTNASYIGAYYGNNKNIRHFKGDRGNAADPTITFNANGAVFSTHGEHCRMSTLKAIGSIRPEHAGQVLALFAGLKFYDDSVVYSRSDVDEYRRRVATESKSS